jgi:hypothetical protein
MNRLTIGLDLEMIKHLVEGNAMTTEIPDIDLVLTLICTPGVAKNFRDTVNDALLHLLPGPSDIH